MAKRTDYFDAQIIEMLSFLKQNTVKATALKFRVKMITLKRWAKLAGVLEKPTKKHDWTAIRKAVK